MAEGAPKSSEKRIPASEKTDEDRRNQLARISRKMVKLYGISGEDVDVGDYTLAEDGMIDANNTGESIGSRDELIYFDGQQKEAHRGEAIDVGDAADFITSARNRLSEGRLDREAAVRSREAEANAESDVEAEVAENNRKAEIEKKARQIESAIRDTEALLSRQQAALDELRGQLAA